MGLVSLIAERHAPRARGASPTPAERLQRRPPPSPLELAARFRLAAERQRRPPRRNAAAAAALERHAERWERVQRFPPPPEYRQDPPPDRRRDLREAYR